jgi:rhodanese-related sulfurtransferase
MSRKNKLSLEVPDAPIRIHAENLREHIKSKEPGLIIVDVREEDYRGGHVTGCLHIPYDEFQATVSEVAKAHRGANKVVFCCMNSQVQSPSCAALFLNKLTEEPSQKRPDVYVLIGGIQGWIRQFYKEADLVTDFDRKLWSAIWEATLTTPREA